MKPRLFTQYKKTIAPALKKQFNLQNVHEVPKVEKVVVNMGVGEAVQNPKAMKNALRDLVLITGQKPLETKAKKSISSFKLREGVAIGLKVTLRGDRMYEFLDRFVNAVLPRTRDFRGVKDNTFDNSGNYSLGIKDNMIFPELIYDEVDKSRPMQIIVVTSTQNKEHSKALIEALGFPLRKLSERE